MEKNNQRIVFILPGDAIITEMIFSILKSNGLEESPTEAYNKSTHGKDSRLTILRDAALTIVQKKVSEEKLVELLQKHLETSKENAEKIIQDIKEKLIPYAKTTSGENNNVENQKEKYREDLLKKIQANKNILSPQEEKTPLPYYKKLAIEDVEENAESMRKEGKNIMTEEKDKLNKKIENNKQPPQNTTSDTYREPIE